MPSTPTTTDGWRGLPGAGFAEPVRWSRYDTRSDSTADSTSLPSPDRWASSRPTARPYSFSVVSSSNAVDRYLPYSHRGGTGICVSSSRNTGVPSSTPRRFSRAATSTAEITSV
ncbi:hypothetical protein [Streptomyces sp. NPDC057557]|uniref:hypothetical protein n=1 Tax=Streptomyces sp. NPDC057557 TaxID=3346167 RepID=UPI0036B01407